MSNNKIVFYDQVWKGNANLALALTKADVGGYSANTRNGYITLVNIQNISNSQLDFIPFEVGETVYANDSGLTFAFTGLDQIIYLDRPLASNGKTFTDNCYGFMPGDRITQYCPLETVDVILTEEDYLNMCGCSKCGCSSSDCSCTGGPTISNRTVTVVLSEARTITANVLFENCNPPYLCVQDSSERFCRYPITNGKITANVVGATSKILERDPYLGNYVIDRPAKYKNFSINDCDMLIANTNIGANLGPHIGIDRHFNGKRSQDYNNDYIIVSNWDITGNNVPIGLLKDLWSNTSQTYTGIGMSVNAISFDDQSSLLKLVSKGNTNATIQISHYGGLNLTANIINSKNKIIDVKNNCNNIILLTSNSFTVNTTLRTTSYAESYQSLTTADLTFNVAQSTIFSIPTGITINSIKFEKPDYTPYDRVYTCSVVVPSLSNIPMSVWDPNILWPTGTPPTNACTAPRILSFMNVHETGNVIRQNTWYGFGSNVVSGTGGGDGGIGGPGSDSYPFRWYRSNASHTVTVTYAWDAGGGTDLNSRTWVTVPSYSASWVNQTLGEGRSSSVYVAPPPNMYGQSSITFTGGGGGSQAENVVIPVDTIVGSDPFFYSDYIVNGIVIGYANTYSTNYSVQSIPNTLHGRTGMTAIITAPETAFQTFIVLPFSIEPIRSRPADRFQFYSNGCDEISFRGTALNTVETFINLAYLKPYDDYQLPDSTITEWMGYITEGSDPDRTFTFRVEYRTVHDNFYYDEITNTYSDYVSPNVYVLEYKFYENSPEQIDINFGSLGDVNDEVEVTYSYTTGYSGADPELGNSQVYGTSYLFIPNRFTENTSKSLLLNDTLNVIPIYLPDYNKYIDIHTGAYWSSGRNSGNFNLKVRNDVTGSEMNYIINVGQAEDLGVGRNEFATFRLSLKYLNLTKIL